MVCYIPEVYLMRYIQSARSVNWKATVFDASVSELVVHKFLADITTTILLTTIKNRVV